VRGYMRRDYAEHCAALAHIDCIAQGEATAYSSLCAALVLPAVIDTAVCYCSSVKTDTQDQLHAKRHQHALLKKHTQNLTSVVYHTAACGGS
jgi:hypothetical protein